MLYTRRASLKRFLPTKLLIIFILFFAWRRTGTSLTLPSSFGIPVSSFFPGSAFRPPPPDTPGFTDYSSYVNLDKVPGSVIALADFNRDRFLDLALLDTNTLKGLSIAVWDHAGFAFKIVGQGLRLDQLPEEHRRPALIEQVHVADYNGDGTVDLLIVGKTSSAIVFSVEGRPGVFNVSNPLYLDTGAVVATMDVNRDLAPDIFVAFGNGTRAFYINDGKGGMKLRPWVSARNKCVLSPLASPAFVDMDGDCLADLVVPSSCGIEIYHNTTELWNANISQAKVLGNDLYNPAQGDGPLTLADFDASGSVDILVPNFDRRDIVVHINSRRVSGRDALCHADSNYGFTRRVGMSAGVNIKSSYLGSFFLSKIHLPPLIRAGDFDMDGYPDLLYRDSSGRPEILRNKNIWNKEAQGLQDHFEPLKPEDKKSMRSAAGSSIAAATFWDSGESGRQDILLVTNSNNTRLVMNGFIKSGEGMFFKGTALGGSSYSSGGLARPFGPATGATFEVAYATRDSRVRKVRVCSQCSALGWALTPCNCLFGLGSISNYIEEMVLGTGQTKRSWTNLMPNSMAVVWADDGQTSEEWWMEYFTRTRGGQMLGVVSILVVVMGILGGVILYLQNNERKQDREEEAERVTLFNFGAL